ncbi:MAG: purine operon repressor [Thermosediminibacterales bacterium]|nr:purine operon repressor [Thermosediminibacterales bacterium]
MKIKRSDRTAVIAKILTENPGKVFPLNYFAELLNSAKSSTSEDIMTIKETFKKLNLGIVETLPGAAGGVRYKPYKVKSNIEKFLTEIKNKLVEPKRIIPGGFIYMTDLIFCPATAFKIGEIFATKFSQTNPDYVLTVETKGIPIALMTARCFDVPLVIARRDSRVTEGTSVSINYISGSSKRIQTMSLPRRALKEGSNVLVIDDFMKGGGTARGMIELMNEFNAEVVGIGVLVATKKPEQKLVKDFLPLFVLNDIEEDSGRIDISIKP